ncbi:hypothetical protein C8A03DRAFT_32206 [Achaetomium macrosporum]|uniref:Uncharacterized protein n=1 Tax=Achaetomium macrosporum TaxID=79813 RepID=A0AAN7CCZ4_9PEZI|nr:hypothetical protein C8A03DRAFT_32206 [Achaetomium macrosporum]
MAPMAARLFSRQFDNCTLTEDGDIDESSCYVPFWNTRTGYIVKWSLFLGIVTIISLYLLLGYIHAQRRIRRGLAPLGYHRFLVSRATLAQVDPRYRYPQPMNVYPYAPEGYYYDMHAMPPPVYDPNAPRPPKYEPPAGSTNVNPAQQQSAQQSQQPLDQHVVYTPPAGPPPTSTQSQGTYAPPPGPPPSATRS